MTSGKEMSELRKKEPKTLLADLAKEKNQLAKDSIALQLGKFSKTHEVTARRRRIARVLTVLGEQVRSAPAPVKKGQV